MLKQCCIYEAGYFKLTKNHSVSHFSLKTADFSRLLLPELHDGAGQVGGVHNAVVCEASLCVPWIVAGFPWKLLQIKKK